MCINSALAATVDDFDDDVADAEPDVDEHASLANMLNNGGADDEYYGYDDHY